jgi:hypothetical protein
MRAIIPLILCGIVLGGCQPTQVDRPSPTSTTLAPEAMPTRVRPQASTGSNFDLDFDVDDCAARLHAIEGDLILYYSRFNRLPAELDELRAMEPAGKDLPLECPVSHKPYIYSPTGLILGNDPQRQLLVVYDSTPAHNGTRWGILFQHASGRKPVNTQVIQIPEQSMVGYHPAPPMAPPATPDPAIQRPRYVAPDGQPIPPQQPVVPQQ